MFTSLSHVSIVVPDLAAAARRLRETYGLVVGEPSTNAEQGVRLAYVDLGNAKIELMESSRADSPVAKFLERNPKGGIHHLSLGVDAMEPAVAALRGQGVRILGDARPQYNVSGERIAFIHPADFLGALVELEEQPISPHAPPHGEERPEGSRLEP
jgi:methylmalonyl-CoA/ethylmalonyl-CoA epimerase